MSEKLMAVVMVPESWVILICMLSVFYYFIIEYIFICCFIYFVPPVIGWPGQEGVLIRKST